MNFRQKLLWSLIPLSVVAIGVVAATSYFFASDGLRQSERNLLKLAVSRTVDSLETWIADRERDARYFASNPVLVAACKGKQLEAAKKQLTFYAKLAKHYEAVFLADINGKIFMDGVGGRATGIEVAKIPGYAINIEKAQTGQVWVGNVMKSPATGRPVSLITAPITDNGKIVGIMGTPIELNEFSESFMNSKLGKTGYLFILDSAGTTLAHPDKKMILKFNVRSLDFGRRILEKGNGLIEYDWKGTPKIAYFQTYAKKKWIVATTINADEVLASIEIIKYLSMALGLGAILLICLVTWVLTGRVFKVVKNAVTGLSNAAGQVGQASKQVSSASHQLAEGSSEQASALEETSSSLEELSSMTRQNAENADQANQLSSAAGQEMQNAGESMGELTTSMSEISDASEEISKIIKTIDEIAFQTNLLALNAAVEAARAGEAGAGFAVVADEVRNLAMRAAEAAKNTAGLIEGTVNKISSGAQLVTRTEQAFEAVSASSGKVAELVAEIAAASSEQSQGLEQINQAMSQMDKLTQGNAATAEETASASEEMDAQARHLLAFVSDLNAVVGSRSSGQDASNSSLKALPAKTSTNSVRKPAAAQNRPAPVSQPKESPGQAASKAIPLDDDDFSDF